MALANLPNDMIFTIMKFASDTRLDWRRCEWKRREAGLIRSLEGGSVLEHQEEPELLNWTLAGRLFMTEIFEQFPRFGRDMGPPLYAPPPMEDFRRWYLLQYRWLIAGEQENRWI
jgi:hypothetical protein